ncbi:MAG: DNA polymerase IV, partial [Lachnospiraceae bacterium]|nr:DNA polymerase IV [Lachnospiraceae bacterium]
MKDTQDNRIIFHIDVNSAFLSWSAVKRLSEDPNAPDLRLIHSAVGGDVKTRHGIITAKSIPAKKFGVKTGEPVMRALEKCPELVLIPSDFTTYRKYSNAFMKILKKYCPAVEKASIDEAYLDMTGLEDRFQRELNAGGTFPRCAA